MSWKSTKLWTTRTLKETSGDNADFLGLISVGVSIIHWVIVILGRAFTTIEIPA